MSDPIEPAEVDPGPDPLEHIEVPPDRPQFAPPGGNGRASVLQPPAPHAAGLRGKIIVLVVLLLVLGLVGGFAIWRKSQPQPVAMPEFAAPVAVATVPVPAEPAPDVKDLLIRLDGLHEAVTSMRAETAQALREQGQALGQLRAEIETVRQSPAAGDGKLLDAITALGQRIQGLETSTQALGQRLAAAATPKPVAKPRTPRDAGAPRIEAVNFWDSVPYATLAGGTTLRAGETHKGWTLVDVEDGRAVLRGPDGRRVVQSLRGGR